MRLDTKAANQYLRDSLLGACVESFGLTHQVLTLTFRDSDTSPNDHILWIDTNILANTTAFDALLLDATARALLLFNHVNLQEVITIYCADNWNLIIEFANGVQLTLDGSSADEYGEPWSFNLSPRDYSVNIIASCGAGYLLFDSRNKLV
ncbi:MAG: hypothetical protein ACRYFV_09105 [Janthinobacterium lividum]